MAITTYKEKFWLIYNLALRQFLQRYRGSFFGVLWPFLAAAIQMAIYAFIFTMIFGGSWHQGGTVSVNDNLPVWVIRFAGMIIYFFCSEIIGAAPTMVLSVPNYVKKVRFPLVVLPVVQVLVSITTTIVFIIVLITVLAFTGTIQWQIILTPLLIIQASFWCLGLSWILSSVGVFIRDLQQLVPFFLQIMLFLTPILYPISTVRENWQIFVIINPLAFIIDTFRNLALWGIMPSWGTFTAWTAGSVLFAWLGLFIFQRLRNSFADVM